jgi:hypothetical protein
MRYQRFLRPWLSRKKNMPKNINYLLIRNLKFSICSEVDVFTGSVLHLRQSKNSYYYTNLYEDLRKPFLLKLYNFRYKV